MTAIYVPPPQPGVSNAHVSFRGMLELTALGNAATMQKSVFLGRAGRIASAWIAGVDGMDTEATGETILRFSDLPHDQQEGTSQFIDLALSAGECRAVAAGSIAIPADGWLHVFIRQAGGGHYGAQIGIHIEWEDI